MRQGRDLIVSECGDGMARRSRLRMLMAGVGVLQGLP
jgi:hypothetical protein